MKPSNERLMAAARSGDVNAVKELVAVEGCDLEAAGKDGVTALMVAVHHRQIEVAQALVDAGAKIDAVDASGRTALMRVAGLSIEFFCDYNASVQREELVRLLLSASASIELADANGKTALLYAAAIHESEPLRALLQANADVETTDRHGNTPLLTAARCGAAESVRLLLEAHARVDVANAASETPLIAAVAFPYFPGDLSMKVVELLIKAHADTLGANRQGQTALHLAAKHGKVDIVNALLEAGADIDARCCKDNTALVYAVEGGRHGDVIEALLQAGANPTIGNQEGKTAMDLLAIKGNRRCAEAIQRAISHRDVASTRAVESSDQGSSKSSRDDGFEVLSNADTVLSDLACECREGDLASSLIQVGQALAKDKGEGEEASGNTKRETIDATVIPESREGHPDDVSSAASPDAFVERSDDNSKVVIAVLDSDEQSKHPFHYAVLASGNNAKCFNGLVEDAESDASVAADVRLTTRSTSVERLCAAEYAHSIGYHEVGDFLMGRMHKSCSLSINKSKAVSVTLLEDSTDFSFIYAAEKSKGSVVRCNLLLDDDEGEEGDKIDRLIQAEVTREVETELVSWSPLELACQLGYLQVVNCLLKRGVKRLERNPVVRARTIERAEALGRM